MREDKKNIAQRLVTNRVMYAILLVFFAPIPLICQEYINNFLKKDYYALTQVFAPSRIYYVNAGINFGTFMNGTVTVNEGTTFPTEKRALTFPLQTQFFIMIFRSDRHSRTAFGTGLTYRTIQENFSSFEAMKEKQNDNILTIGYRSDVSLSNKYLGLTLYYSPILVLFGKRILSVDLNIEYMFDGKFENIVYLDQPISHETMSNERNFQYSENGKKAIIRGELPKGASRWSVSLSANYNIWREEMNVYENDFGSNYIIGGIDAKLGFQFFSMYSSDIEIAPALSLCLWFSIPTIRL